MKSKIHPFLSLIVLSSTLQATPVVWDTVAGNDSTITAGDGTWTTGGPNWNNGTTSVNWTAGDTATFQSSDDLGSYTITVGGAITTGNAVSSLTFANSGYTLKADTAQTITIGNANATSTIKVESGKTATLGDKLTVQKGGTGALLIMGGGTLKVGSGATGGGAMLKTTQSNAGEIRTGTTLEITTGGDFSSARSQIVGALTVDDTLTNTLKITGGKFTITNGTSTNNLVLGNNTTGKTSSAIVDITEGDLINQATGGALRYGPGTADAGTICTGTVNLDGGTLTIARVFQGTEENGGSINSTFNFNGGTLKVLTGSTSATDFLAGLDAANVKAGGAIIDTNGVNTAIDQDLQEDAVSTGGGLIKQGAGILTLSGTNTYTGTTEINIGRLDIVGSLVSDVFVAENAAVGGEGSALGSITFEPEAITTLAFNPSTSGALTAASIDTTDATVTVYPTSPPAAGETYLVLTNTAGFTGSPAPTYKVASRGTLSFSGNNLNLTAAAPKSLIWKGEDDTNPTFWDIDTTSNWDSSGPEKFYNNDAVTFNDSATGTDIIIQSVPVSPASMTFNHSTNDFTISGGTITGTSGLQKSGTGTLTLSSINTFTGGTTINNDAGTVIAISNATETGLGTGAISIGTGSTLQFNTSAGIGNTIAEAITGSGLLKINFAASGAAVGSTLNVGGFTGTIQLSTPGGTRDKWDANNLGTIHSALIIDSGTQLYPSAGTTTFTNGITVQGIGNNENRGAIRLVGILGGNITLAGDTTIGNSNGSLTGNITSGLAGTQVLSMGTTSATGTANLSGAIGGGTGTIALTTVRGTTTLSGTAANTYTGLTTISGGGLTLNKTPNEGPPIVPVTAVAGDLLIGAGTLTHSTSDQIADTSTVTMNAASAKWDLGGKSETIATLDIQNAGSTTNAGLALGVAGKLKVNGTLTHAAGNITINSSGVGNQSVIDANTVVNTGGTWIFGTTDGTQSLVIGSGGLTIGGGSTIDVAATTGSPNFIDLGGNVTSQANAAANTINGAGNIKLNGPRTFSVEDDAANATDLTIATPLVDGAAPSALIKDGPGTLTLSGLNTYSGNTTVNVGMLALTKVNASNESSTVSIASSGASLNLTFTGTDVVDKLFIGGVQQAAGIYKATDNPNTGNPISQITGPGTLTVTSQPTTAGYAQWESSKGVSDGPNGDDDKDGISNLIEYALGLEPKVSNPSPGTLIGKLLSFDKNPNATDVVFAIETSTTLATGSWSTVTPDANNASIISYTLPNDPSGKLFARLKVLK